jgi:catalase
LFSYHDAQRYRLGVDHHHIPVNAPKCRFHSYHRDGAMRTDGNLGRTPTYWPNSRGEWTDQPQLNEPPLEISGAAAHWDQRVDDDHWQQPKSQNVRSRERKPLTDELVQCDRYLNKTAPFCELCLPQSGLCRGEHYIASMANGAKHDD